MKQRPERSFISAQQVADLAGVSRSAVSRTFTEGASVSDATRKRVLQAAEKLGYHVNHLARGLMNDRSNIVCIVTADIDAPYHGQFIEALTRQLQAVGKVAMIVNASGGSGIESAMRLTLQYRADASIVLSGQPDRQIIENCISNGQSVIVVNRDETVAGTKNINVSNRASAREAFHMLHRVGCTNLAVVTSTVGTPSLLARERAFVEEAQRAGLDVPVVRIGSTSYESGAAAARQLFCRTSRPDGAFCVTDLLACGFMDVAREEFDISIPQELCVVGFDNIMQSGWAAYDLTTFRQPIEDIAAYMVSLVDGDTGDVGEQPKRFLTEPVWRKSVRPK
ncbi:LacI family DNA-binding transcriptional regulator [Oceanibium sediminis]|uniref:LacI family DNA-binding transcriptional regulator n=1 Tax=Oceanibium sediminis TaxID=2026339 RepID=UPI001E384A39|nr:substrate-binding domain-containing protein [Oceanibium sediminis]